MTPIQTAWQAYIADIEPSEPHTSYDIFKAGYLAAQPNSELVTMATAALQALIIARGKVTDQGYQYLAQLAINHAVALQDEIRYRQATANK